MTHINDRSFGKAVRHRFSSETIWGFASFWMYSPFLLIRPCLYVISLSDSSHFEFAVTVFVLNLL